MSRPFIVPDPNDRSVNSPSIIVKSTQILGYYNSLNKDDKKERVVDSLKTWYKQKAKETGWKKATFHGSDCLLEVKVALKK